MNKRKRQNTHSIRDFGNLVRVTPTRDSASRAIRFVLQRALFVQKSVGM